MKKQEILMSLVIAYEEKKWDRVESILREEGLNVQKNAEIKKTEDVKLSFSVRDDSKFHQNKFDNQKNRQNKFVNNFIDDMTMETKDIELDRKITANVKPKMRRPPVEEAKNISVVCRNCNKQINISSFEYGLQNSSGSSFTCASCLKNLRGTR